MLNVRFGCAGGKRLSISLTADWIRRSRTVSPKSTARLLSAAAHHENWLRAVAGTAPNHLCS